jgi:hypothetical protein
MAARLTFIDVQKEINSVTDYILLSTEYKNNSSPLVIKHKCGREYTSSYDNFIRKGQRCRCLRNSEKTMSTEEYINKIKAKHGDKYTLIGEYTNTITLVRIKHSICGKEFNAKPLDILSKEKYCPICSGKGQGGWTDTKVREYIKTKTNDKVLLVNSYQILPKDTYKQELILYFKKCGHEKSTRLQDIIDYTVECRMCNPLKITNEILKKEFEALNGEYTLLSEYNGDTHSLLTVRHEVCKHVYTVSRSNIIVAGSRCPKCNINLKTSKAEKEILDYVLSLDPLLPYIQNDRKALNGSELDIYFPTKKIAIEHNGLYWHSEEKVGKKYHLEKLTKCADNNIRLVQIFEDEWTKKQEIVKSKIRSILGYNTKSKIYARKCYVANVPSNIKTEFLNRNHIQGKDKANVTLGLYLKENDELVSIMTFVKPRLSLNGDGKAYDFELSRFASNIDYCVIGAFSKLFSYFKKNNTFKAIITYADLRWSEGGVYDTNGFKYTHTSSPSYWYFKNEKERFHRFNFRKNVLEEKLKVFDPNKTEYENMVIEGYSRVWDCGNLVFKYAN